MKRMTSLAAIACIILSSCGNPGNGSSTLRMLVGTYTKTDSQGVYLYEFNQDDATFTLLDTAKAGSPSFIVPSEDGRFAYSVSEFNDGSEGACSYKLGDGSIDVLNFQSSNPALPCAPQAVNGANIPLGQTPGGAPCNIVVANGQVITSNYMGGTLSVFPIEEDGSLGPMSGMFIPKNDEGIISHIHCATVSPDGRYLFVNDLGADIIYRFRLGAGGVDLSDPQEAFRFDRDAHPGPRHMVFSRDGRFAYLLGETGDNLTVFSYSDGVLTRISSRTAYDGEGHGSADIHLGPDGKFLYTSHRLKKEGISVFKVDGKSGDVEEAGFFPTGGHPRNFAITPNGKYLLCACRHSNAIEVYSIDGRNGGINKTGTAIAVPEPVCIQLF